MVVNACDAANAAGQLQLLQARGRQGLQGQAGPLELWARLEFLYKSDCRKVK